MAKSILAIDTPENCYSCGIRLGYLCGGISGICGIGKNLPVNLRRPEWCPLKEVPQKKPDEAMGEWLEFNNGWNACIDEILKERDEQ